MPRRHASLSGYVCVYCGEPANTRDHIPPKGFVSARPVLVRACVSCNGILRDQIILTIKDRAYYLLTRVKRPEGRVRHLAKVAEVSVEPFLPKDPGIRWDQAFRRP